MQRCRRLASLLLLLLSLARRTGAVWREGVFAGVRHRALSRAAHRARAAAFRSLRWSPRDESVDVLKRRTDWFKVRTERGIEGWASQQRHAADRAGGRLAVHLPARRSRGLHLAPLGDGHLRGRLQRRHAHLRRMARIRSIRSSPRSSPSASSWAMPRTARSSTSASRTCSCPSGGSRRSSCWARASCNIEPEGDAGAAARPHRPDRLRRRRRPLLSHATVLPARANTRATSSSPAATTTRK